MNTPLVEKKLGFFSLLDVLVNAIERGVEIVPMADPDNPEKINDMFWVTGLSATEDSKLTMVSASTMLSDLMKRQVLSQHVEDGSFLAQVCPYGGNYYFAFKWPEGQEIDLGSIRDDIQKCKDMLGVSTESSISLQTVFNGTLVLNPLAKPDKELFENLINVLSQYQGMPDAGFYSLEDVVLADRSSPHGRACILPIIDAEAFAELVGGELDHIKEPSHRILGIEVVYPSPVNVRDDDDEFSIFLPN